jgi:mono/diheme cytochrome c family protein
MVNVRNTTRGLLIALGLVWMGCTYYENETIKLPQPKVSKPTTTLEAAYTSTAPNKVTSAYWKTANYLPIVPQNLITGQVPADDGLYNVSGIFNGLTDFNKGKVPEITLKAAYDDNNLYILVSWKDTTFNMSSANWVYNGATDPLKSGSTTGWTSQRSDDKLFLSFDMGSSKRDVWNWSLALSEPIGYATDMLDNSSVVSADAGDKTYVRNIKGADNRSGPQYQWDGVQQELRRTPGGLTILDPGFYLLTKQNFVGDVVAGDVVFQNNCAPCHGVKADGLGTEYETDVALNPPGKMDRLTRAALVSFASDANQHEGAAHFIGLTDTEIDNLYARLRGFSGIPGYYLQNPSGSNSDVHALSNVQLAKIDGYNTKGYSVLLIRSLNTGNTDDIVFNPTVGQYQFNISVSDNDDLNRIGEINNTLTFKSK